jgi:hypothetical protein
MGAKGSSMSESKGYAYADSRSIRLRGRQGCFKFYGGCVRFLLPPDAIRVAIDDANSSSVDEHKSDVAADALFLMSGGSRFNHR